MKASLLDTDIFSHYMKGNQKVVNNVINYLTDHATLNLSSISYFEVLKGLEYKKAIKQKQAFEHFLTQVNLINVSKKSMQISAKIYGDLRRNGITIGVSDLLIAGVAIENNFQLITNNTKHFKSIEDLTLSNWLNN